MENITDISQLEKYRGKIVFVEVGWNPFLTRFHKIKDRDAHYWPDGYFGYDAELEVSKKGVHGSHALTTMDLQRGTLRVREATPEEISKVKISYSNLILD